VPLVLILFLFIASHCLFGYSNNISKITDLKLNKPSIHDLRGDLSHSVANHYVEDVIKQYDDYMLIKAKIEHYQTVVPNELLLCLKFFYFPMVVNGFICSFPGINIIVAMLFGVSLTIAIIILDYKILSKLDPGDAFNYTREELEDKYFAEHPTPPYPISETQAINNYILSWHLNFLMRIYNAEKKRYQTKIIGLIVYGILFILFVKTL
jgi:hypothetical protein